MRLGMKGAFTKADKERNSPSYMFGGHRIAIDLELLENVTIRARMGDFVLFSDEGQSMGGDSNAPEPMQHFVSGIGFSFLSCFSRSASDFGLSIDRISLKMISNTRIYRGLDKISCELEVVTNEPRELVERVVRLAEERAPAVVTIKKIVPFSVDLKLDASKQIQN